MSYVIITYVDVASNDEYYTVIPDIMNCDGIYQIHPKTLALNQFVVRMSINRQNGKITNLNVGSYGKPIGTYFTPDEVRTIINRQEFIKQGTMRGIPVNVNISVAMSIIDNFITMNPGITKSGVDIINNSGIRFESCQILDNDPKPILTQIMKETYNDKQNGLVDKRYMFMVHYIPSHILGSNQIGHAVTLVADLNSLPVRFKIFDSQRPIGISDSNYGSYIHINVNNNDLSYKGLLNPTRYDGYNYSPQPIDANDCTYWAEATVLELNKLVTNKFNHKGEFIVLDGLALNFNNPDFRKQLEDRKKMLEDKAAECFMDCEDARENISQIVGLSTNLGCAIGDITNYIDKSNNIYKG